MRPLSVGQLYPLALAEGEGVGTAYEYLAKRLVLGPWLGKGFKPARIVMVGLPEKYGSSLDFALIAAEYQAQLTVLDERPEALEKFDRSLSEAQRLGQLRELGWRSRLVEKAYPVCEHEEHFDLALSSEVLQRVAGSDRGAYLEAMAASAARVALFCPNADNQAHANLSGLASISLEDLGRLTSNWTGKTGFIDMPPFPPGLTRSDAQREQAATGRLEALAMSGLGVYARVERFIPERIRRRKSHIVFATIQADRRGRCER